MIKVKSTDVKFRGSDKDLIIECSVLMRFVYQINPAAFAEIIRSIQKEVEKE